MVLQLDCKRTADRLSSRTWRPSADGRHTLCLNAPISMSFVTFFAVG
ncbi:hypothetical protein ABID19_004957 [Mesorhizobium robiniae]|uniref:Uncharacterized protein n=1 Tax=Mesorhizobium robiniae TaxID=559315 RepID=A0ABV2GUU5_9HYPH